MGTNSGNGMGPGRRIPGHKTFEGSAARYNAQTEISRLIAHLPHDPKEAMRREIAAAWRSGKEPQEVYDMVYARTGAGEAADSQDPGPTP